MIWEVDEVGINHFGTEDSQKYIPYFPKDFGHKVLFQISLIRFLFVCISICILRLHFSVVKAVCLDF